MHTHIRHTHTQFWHFCNEHVYLYTNKAQSLLSTFTLRMSDNFGTFVISPAIQELALDLTSTCLTVISMNRTKP